MKRSHIALVITTVAALACTACGGGTNEDGSSKPSTAATSATASAASTAKAATCHTGGKGAAEVKLEQTDEGLTLTFIGQPIPATGEIQYAAMVYTADGNHGVQIGAKYLNGKQIGYFVFDFDTAMNANLDGSPSVSGNTVTVAFPADELDALTKNGGAAAWSPAVSINGKDFNCPGGDENGLVPFPGA